MFKEFDTIKAKHSISKVILKGTVGTIFMVYKVPTLDYEVDFIDDLGNSLGWVYCKTIGYRVIKYKNKLQTPPYLLKYNSAKKSNRSPTIRPTTLHIQIA